MPPEARPSEDLVAEIRVALHAIYINEFGTNQAKHVDGCIQDYIGIKGFKNFVNVRNPSYVKKIEDLHEIATAKDAKFADLPEDLRYLMAVKLDLTPTSNKGKRVIHDPRGL